jgi:Zn-dependent protease
MNAIDHFVLVVVLALAVHEAGHAIEAVKNGMKVKSIRVTALGFSLVIGRGTPEQNFKVAMAGPIYSLVACLVALVLQQSFLAEAHLYFCLMNLLPFKGSDGSNMLACVRKELK